MNQFTQKPISDKSEPAGEYTEEPIITDTERYTAKPRQNRITAGTRKPQKKHRVRKYLLGIFGVAALATIAGGVYAYRVTSAFSDKPNQLGFIEQIHRVLDTNVDKLRGEKEDRINVLLLGNGGDGHAGGSLTDTIMVASIKPSTKQVALLSLPRDLVVNFGSDNGAHASYRKINNMVFLGGMDLAKEKIKDVTGLDIQYTLQVDFDAFRDIIDTIGGVNVTVDNAFTDYEYPDYNYGYQTISFKTGEQPMDGERALQFARSRHGNNGEGSDFARAARQQKILEAVQAKLLSLSTLLNPVKIGGILNDLGDHVSTDMEIWEMLRFASIAKEIDRSKIINQVVDNSSDGLVHTDRSEETGASIVVPNAGLGNFSEIQAVAQYIFDPVAPDTASTNPAQESAIIAVQNGSSITGLATNTAAMLKAKGFGTATVGNGLTKLSTSTVIYDVSGGKFPLTSQALATLFGVPVQQSILPSTNTGVRSATDVDSTKVDLATLPSGVNFILLLGSDAATVVAKK